MPWPAIFFAIPTNYYSPPSHALACHKTSKSSLLPHKHPAAATTVLPHLPHAEPACISQEPWQQAAVGQWQQGLVEQQVQPQQQHSSSSSRTQQPA